MIVVELLMLGKVVTLQYCEAKDNMLRDVLEDQQHRAHHVACSPPAEMSVTNILAEQLSEVPQPQQPKRGHPISLHSMGLLWISF